MHKDLDCRIDRHRVNRRSPMVFAIGVVALSWSLAHLAGCNTIEGAGRDIESAGDAIADTARDAKD